MRILELFGDVVEDVFHKRKLDEQNLEIFCFFLMLTLFSWATW